MIIENKLALYSKHVISSHRLLNILKFQYKLVKTGLFFFLDKVKQDSFDSLDEK